MLALLGAGLYQNKIDSKKPLPVWHKPYAFDVYSCLSYEPEIPSLMPKEVHRELSDKEDSATVMTFGIVPTIEEEINARLAEIEIIEDSMDYFRATKELMYEYDYHFDPPESVYDKFSHEEIYLMQRCIETEAYTAPFDCKVNVANVILNRLDDGRFGESITEIITNPNQFAYGRTEITESTILALECAAMMGDTTDGALYFHSGEWIPEFNNRAYKFTDSVGHKFY